MQKIEKKEYFEKDDLGFIMRQLEELENFYPCYRTMIKKEE